MSLDSDLVSFAKPETHPRKLYLMSLLKCSLRSDGCLFGNTPYSFASLGFLWL